MLDRAVGALGGLALGDALGMPTQNFPRSVIRERFGVVDDFHPGPDDNEISRGLPAGRVTDDTDQAVILGRSFVAGGGRVEPRAFADALLAWEERMRAEGSLDLLGPSTRRALALVAEGVSPDETGRWGDTNGAAMRIAPIGVGVPLAGIVDAVEQASRVTHHTGVAIAGAAAIAAAVSSGVEGRPLAESLAHAIDAARLGAERGSYVPGADVATRIEWALHLVGASAPPAAAERARPDEALDLVYRLVGTGLATQEAVPAALALASLYPGDVWEACRHAASLGGDCDTIAAMTGAVVGAHVGWVSVPAGVRARLTAANPGLALDGLAEQLISVRSGAASRPR
ncbi:ADP-ribosylglycohydrolase family protein [Cryptosporangium sp. NPDC048952]|uniref:ADP-ribosylglycohydrolase family protein n=1 Tax=Cryptosporangium sp. NPDC048952 TaxID=3363961 RepID=UPI00371F4779